MRFRVFRFTEEKQSRRDALKWWYWRALLGILGLWLFLLIWMPLTMLMITTQWGQIGVIFVTYLSETFSGDYFKPFVSYGKWLWAYIALEPRHVTWLSFFAWKMPLFPLGLFMWYEFYLFMKNPHFFDPQTFGDGREATANDLKNFDLLNQNAQGLFLGLFHGLKMKLPDTRSVFCIGAPGSGKTAGVVIPAILEGNNTCMIIHDPKGELAKATSGHRAKLGPVFRMNWSASDNPAQKIFWPSWNPIGGSNLPSLQNGREGYIDTLISFLIPDGPTDKNADSRTSGMDPYWSRAGRGCLTGLTGYLCGKVDQAKANDYFLSRLKENELDEQDYAVLISYYQSMRDFPEVKEALKNAEARKITLENYLPIGKWDLIPQNWRGPDACFAMLLDILNNAQMKFTQELAERRAQKDPSIMNLDPWKMILEEIVLETAYYGYGRRTLLELTQVDALPDKQRGSVISMALSGVNIFKNSAIRARTSLNDFNYNQLRGIKDEKTGEYKPVTIYLSVPLEEIGTTSLVSSLFINMASGYLMEHGPDSGGTGSFPMTFILDEFQHMPSLQSITDGIVFGRSKKTSFLVSVQDWHQISSKYDQETANIIMSSVAVKIIKRHNNPDTRNAVIKGVMPLTKVVHSYSSTRCKFDWGGGAIGLKKGYGVDFWHSVSHKIKTQSDTVMGGSGFLSMADTKQVVLYAGHLHRPIAAQTPLYFKNAEYKALSQIKQADPMSEGKPRTAEELERVSTMQFDQ